MPSVSERLALRPAFAMIAYGALAGAALIVLAFPVVGVSLIALALAMGYRSRASAVPLVVTVTTVFIFAVSNTSKALIGDWAWYSKHYSILQYTTLSDYLGSNIDYIVPERSEPVYYVIARFLSVTTGANESILAIVVTALIYMPVGAAVALSVREQTARASVIGAAVFAGLMAGITFTLSTQLIRQEIAAAMVGLAVVVAARRKYFVAGVLLVLAALTHNSSIVPAVAVLLAIIVSRARTRTRIVILPALMALFFGLGVLYLRTGGDARYTGANDGEIGLPVMVLDAVLATVFIAVMWRRREDAPIVSHLILVLPCMAGFLLGVASQPLPLLRMYFYVEVFRAIVIGVLVAVGLRRVRLPLPWIILIIVCGFIYLSARIANSPFEYGILPIDVLFFSPLI